MSQLTKLNFTNFDSVISSPNDSVPGLQYIIDSKLIPDEHPKKCIKPGCDGMMVLSAIKLSMLGKGFVCRKCRKQINWTKGTIFESCKLTILTYLKLIFCWCQNKSIKVTSMDLGINEKTVSHHFRMLRMVCYNILNRDKQMIGGTGKVVEIDETMIFKRKYNRGRLSSNQKRQVWVFGGIERESKATFAEIVEKRDEKTLIDVIKNNILPGTTIYSDCWKSYNNLDQYNFYSHDTVNHSKNFLNPVNKNVHTQNIERNWRSLKDHIPKSSNGPNRDDHLIEFLYKSKYHNRNEPTLNFEVTLKHLQNNPFSMDQLDVFDYPD